MPGGGDDEDREIHESGHLGVDEGCLGRKACSTSLQVDEDESVLKIGHNYDGGEYLDADSVMRIVVKHDYDVFEP